MQTTRVEFHCHSVHSDGVLTPREAADYLAAGRVVAAALTDHNTVDGLDEFRRILARSEIGCIPGVEITAFLDGREVHLLAYGIDPTHEELLAVLASLRQAHAPGLHSVAESIRTKGNSVPGGATTPEGRLDAAEAIALAHRAGGRVFLAHPLVTESDFPRLTVLIEQLQVLGMDGIEGYYGQFSDQDSRRLCELADRLGLLVSAGMDLHDRGTPGSPAGIEMPARRWKAFRDAVCCGEGKTAQPAGQPAARLRPRFKWRNYLFHFIVPTLLAILLFITAIFAVILPAFERSLLDRKREMIRELTNSAWSILAGYERDERAGRLTRAEAQARAIASIESLRYGSDRKDYFWLQDMQPRIIMHPYRKDLNGQDVSGFRDPRGAAIFKEFASVVQRSQEGYAQYVWQWKDDPKRLEPKESYVMGFAPWGWIIGTGIYIEDVTGEIKRIERNLVQTSLFISIFVVLLLVYVMVESLRLERERADAETSLHESTERYRSLVEATTEGTLLVLDGRCRYANPTFLELLGAGPRELEMLDLADLFPDSKENEGAWKRLHELLNGEEAGGGFDAVIRRRDGSLLECVFSPSRITFAERSGFILLARRVAPLPEDDAAQIQRREHLQQVVDELPVGVFRARASLRGTLVAFNRATVMLLSDPDRADNAPLSLADVFAGPALYSDFLGDLERDGTAERRLHLAFREPGCRTVAIVARLIRDEHGAPHYLDGVVEDVTGREQHATELEATVERLQTSLLFLHEPVSRVGRSAIFCPLDTPIRTVAAMMTDAQASAALVQSEAGAIVGIVTDGDIRHRVVAAETNRNEPVFRIMSAPLVTISERAAMYEALLLMEQRKMQHLAVEDDLGRIVGVIRNQELLQFRSYGPIVLTREVEGAATPEEVVRACRRVPGLARALLDSGAHPHLVTRMISAACNAATARLIALAEEELGPAPVPYAFLALGSQGRQEMTLASDQDNAILYQDPADDETAARAETYLLELGRFVCGWLDRAGYSLCKGEVLAQNPRWCRPLSAWKGYFSEWIERAEPQQLLEFTIFFDFRPVHGEAELARDLRRHLFEQLRGHPAFYPHFAQNALLFKPPARLFGRLLGGAGEHAGHLDLKDAVMPIVNFARLYALRQGVDATHTLDRLQTLEEAGVLTASSRQEINNAYELLMRLRLRHQAAALVAGQAPDNAVHPRRFAQAEQTLVSQAFTEISAIQKRISYDFLGGTS
ncbi:MAG: DUF294 nucleotidyltransferase-like domain-containing protein [Armatimonadota bacterium]